MTKKNKSGIEYLEQNHINWFPGHMKKAIEKIQESLKLKVRKNKAPFFSIQHHSSTEYFTKNLRP